MKIKLFFLSLAFLSALAFADETPQTAATDTSSVESKQPAGNSDSIPEYTPRTPTGKRLPVIVPFIGVAPMNAPRYVVLVALATPNAATGQYISGGVMAAPTCAAVFEDILPYLGIEPEYDPEDMSRVNVMMPDVIGLDEAAASKLLAESSLSYRLIGDGSSVVSQIPAAGKELPGNSVVLLYTDSTMPTDKVEVPNLMGMTVAEATQALSELGLYLQAKGTDSTAWHVVVTDQDIEVGTKVSRGTTITVIFADTTAMD